MSADPRANRSVRTGRILILRIVFSSGQRVARATPSICVPSCFLFRVSALRRTLAFIRGWYRRWRRSHRGLCLACGYDLTGNVGGRCSECGMEAAPP